ncbi:hypothetical protein IT408_00415 [Candidatus Uhrbacteria bacterium]|nr:hypothetical protein [Candidatus Uhrbacteria bacterium]
MKKKNTEKMVVQRADKNSLDSEQLVLLNHALGHMDVRYRQFVTPFLSSFIMRHAACLKYDKTIQLKLKKLFEGYTNINQDDWRHDVLFRVSAYRFYRETGETCPPTELTEKLGNRCMIEVCIGFGFLALVWQANRFSEDIIQTPSHMTLRYPVLESHKSNVISPS